MVWLYLEYIRGCQKIGQLIPSMSNALFAKLAEKYPFISLCVYANAEYVGVIQRQDQKLRYLELATIWWWESNRSIPINIFLRGEWDPFRYTLRTFTNRDLEILHGPVCSLMDIVRKKSKRKSIVLVRRV